MNSHVLMVEEFMCSGELKAMMSVTTYPLPLRWAGPVGQVKWGSTRPSSEDQCRLPLALSSLWNRPAVEITTSEENGDMCVFSSGPTTRRRSQKGHCFLKSSLSHSEQNNPIGTKEMIKFCPPVTFDWNSSTSIVCIASFLIFQDYH